MDRKTYYVSVQAGTVLEDQGAAAYEFEIQATEKEKNRLQEIIGYKEMVEKGTFFRSHVPAIQYHVDNENDDYDYYLTAIYKLIHALGTPETRRTIEQMGIQ